MLAVTRMDVSNVVGHSAGQCQGGVPIRKCSHHVNPAAGITVWPFNHAAGADARPVFYSITITASDVAQALRQKDVDAMIRRASQAIYIS